MGTLTFVMGEEVVSKRGSGAGVIGTGAQRRTEFQHSCQQLGGRERGEGREKRNTERERERKRGREQEKKRKYRKNRHKEARTENEQKGKKKHHKGRGKEVDRSIEGGLLKGQPRRGQEQTQTETEIWPSLVLAMAAQCAERGKPVPVPFKGPKLTWSVEVLGRA